MSTVVVRSAAASDLPALARLAGGLFAIDAGRFDPWTDQDWPARDGETYFGRLIEGDTSAIWLAVVDDEPIGYATGTLGGPYSTRPVPVADLESVFVVAEHRGGGAGEALVRAFLGWARVKGAELAQVTAYSGNVRAQAFYERIGFHPHTVTFEMRV
jgi:GNAT superfamily N-acetyltransferase